MSGVTPHRRVAGVALLALLATGGNRLGAQLPYETEAETGPSAALRGVFQTQMVDDRVVVTANAPAQPCDRALADLARTMQWRVRWQMGELRDQLAEELVDLSCRDMDPRHAARLIAVVAGTDVVFRETGGGVDVIVVQEPDADTANGRSRLRQSALDWYEEFLRTGLGEQPADSADVLLRRFAVGEILQERGDYDAAVANFDQVYQLAPFSNLGPRALLAMAECAWQIGEGALTECQRYAGMLLRVHPGAPEVPAALALYGRSLLRQGQAAACADLLADHLRRTARQIEKSPERIEVHLVRMQALFELDQAQRLAESLEDLLIERRAVRGRQQMLARVRAAAGHSAELPTLDVFADLTPEQRARLEFFRGHVAMTFGQPDRALFHLRAYFAATDDRHPLRPEAWVEIGRAWFGVNRFMQARGAAVEARELRGHMTSIWARRCSELWAQVLLALGEADTVYSQLELDVRGDGDKGALLALHLADLYHASGQYARCVRTLDKIAGRGDEIGDQARVQKIEALLAQARAAGELAAFPERALPVAADIADADRRREVAALFGSVYDELGDVARAADAWRGVLSR